MRDFYLSSENLVSIQKNTNPYLQKLRQGFASLIYEENTAPAMKGRWAQDGFKNQNPVDLEIGTGNGYFFSHHAFSNPNRNLLGFEIKYRCIYQTIKRAHALGLPNVRMGRIHASLVSEVFGDNEVDNVYIFFPDPWPKKKHAKNRLIQDEFLKNLYAVQKPQSFLEFKTDNAAYFEWAVQRLQNSAYKVERLTYDLHNSEWNGENFQTHFEKLWTRKGLKTMMFRASKT